VTTCVAYSSTDNGFWVGEIGGVGQRGKRENSSAPFSNRISEEGKLFLKLLHFSDHL